MVKRYEQTVLKPGRYFLGYGDNGEAQYTDLTREEIGAYVDGNKKLLAAGYAPPLLFAHADPGSDDGAPKSRADKAAEQVRNGAGWLADFVQNANGEGVQVLDVTDATAIEQLDSGSVKFTSPELRKAWVDGKGTVHQNVFGHVALLHKPRNPDQSAIVPVDGVMQFGLDDLVDDDEKNPTPGEAPSAAAQEDTAGPDMPKQEDVSGGKIKQRVAAIIAHMAEMGVILPEDTPDQEIETILDRVLTGLMTAADCKKKAEAEAEPDEDDKEGKEPSVIEQGGMVQYGLSELESIKDKAAGKYLGMVAKELTARIDALLSSGRITPAGRGELLSMQPAVQFGADFEMLPTIKYESVLSMLEALPKGMHADEAMIQQLGIEDHPEPEYWTEGTGGQMSAEDAKKAVDQQAAALPGMFKS